MTVSMMWMRPLGAAAAAAASLLQSKPSQCSPKHKKVPPPIPASWGEAPGSGKRVRSKTSDGPAGSFTPSFYNQQVKLFDSRAAALQALGVGTRCTGHCARSVKTSGQLTFLRCKLLDSTPSCTWMAMVQTTPDGCQGCCKLNSNHYADYG